MRKLMLICLRLLDYRDDFYDSNGDSQTAFYNLEKNGLSVFIPEYLQSDQSSIVFCGHVTWLMGVQRSDLASSDRLSYTRKSNSGYVSFIQ